MIKYKLCSARLLSHCPRTCEQNTYELVNLKSSSGQVHFMLSKDLIFWNMSTKFMPKLLITMKNQFNLKVVQVTSHGLTTQKHKHSHSRNIKRPQNQKQHIKYAATSKCCWTFFKNPWNSAPLVYTSRLKSYLEVLRCLC